MEFAAKRIISSVWTLAYERVGDKGIEILAHTHESNKGYEEVGKLPRFRIVVAETEVSKRTAVKVELETEDSWETLDVVNPADVFDYRTYDWKELEDKNV